MKYITLFLVFLIATFAISANAAGGLGAREINSVAHQTGGFFLYSNWDNPNGCSKSDAIVLLDTDSNYDKAYSLVLAAFMAGKRVEGYSNGCMTFDGQTYNTIRGYKYLKVYK